MTLEEFLERYKPGTKVDFDGVYGAQCFTAGHYVLMADGKYKAIEDIKIGDKIIDADGETQNVEQVFKRNAPVLKVKTEHCDFEVTEEHPFLYQDGSFSSILDIGKKTPCLYDFQSKESSGLTENELFFIGLWLADGSLERYKNGRNPDIRITGGAAKKQLIDSLSLKGYYRDRGNGNFDWVLKKTPYPKLVETIYNCYNECREKTLPLTFQFSEYEKILEGYIVGDGSKHHNGYVISTTSRALGYSVLSAMNVAGYDNFTFRKRKRGCKPIYIKGVRVKSVKDIFAIHCVKKSERKRSPKIVDVCDGGIQTVYNIEVSGSHTYICNGYKVHNCVDLFRQYCKDVWNTPHLGGVVGAKDLWLAFDRMPRMKQYLERVPIEQAKRGDVVIFDSTKTNKYGHVAILTAISAEGNIQVFEQDGFAQTGTKFAVWRADRALGVLRKKEIA